MASLFFSYSHKDEELRNELETHLTLLRRQGIITAWHDRRITAGSDIHSTISAELEAAQIILLLVSANFLASDYCFEIEMNRALEKHAEGSAVVIPVVLHPCDWHSSPFGGLKATPTDGKPISMFANLHEALAIVAKDIRDAAQKFSSAEVSNDQPLRGQEYTSQVFERSSNLRLRRKFDDHEKDGFLEDSYEYMARYFEGSLAELEKRNPQIKTRFKRVDATTFSASIYESGQRVAECSIWYGSGGFGSGINYSNQADVGRGRNSYNESLSIADNGISLQLKPLGMQFSGNARGEAFSQQGAAEYYWSIFIQRLQ